MRNTIKYYYNIDIDEIHQQNKMYKFSKNGNFYVLYPYQRTIEELKEIYEIHLNIQRSGYYCHKMIKNNNHELITRINEHNYVLLQTYILEKKVTYNDIYAFSKTIIKLDNYRRINRTNWIKLWSEKTDYIEYQINQLGQKYPVLRETSDYYIGIVENCILMLYLNKEKNIDISISHSRINNKTTLFDLYNPLNFIIDYRVRNIAEYIKNNLYENEEIIMDLKNMIEQNNLGESDIIYLFIRLLYPSNYFDIFENIINGKVSEESIKKMLKKNNIYEKNIKNIYQYIYKRIKIPEIEWLKNS